MPEGPEVRLDADRLDRALSGRRVTRCRFAFERLQRFEQAIEGQRVFAVESRGKAMLIRVAGGLTIYSHNQLYGRWFVMAAGEKPKTRRTLRLALENEKRAALLYSASEIEVLSEEEMRNHRFLSKLGPDILGAKTTPGTIKRRLGAARFRNRRLAALFLDQSFLAGLGNYLRSEILFDARLDPDRRPSDLTEVELAELGRSVRRITRRTYLQKGICTEPAAYRRFLRDGERRGSARFHVYRRDGRPCRACGLEVRRQDRAGRAIFYCPECQG